MRTFKRISVFVLPVVLAAALSACTVMPQAPKYPIYMENRPVAEGPRPAPVEPSQAPAEEPTGIQPLGSKGGITTTELPPPPPPPPPANTVATKPGPTAPKPVATLPVHDSRAGFVYTLQPKDTLFGVSRRFGVPVQTLYKMNGLASDSVTHIGQKILLPETAKDKGTETYASGPAPDRVKAVVAQADAPRPAVMPPAPKPVVSAPVAKPVVTAPTPAPAKPVEVAKSLPSDTAGIVKLGKGRFVWPYKGNVLVRYGQLAPNVRNDGINIGGPEGVDIVAADEGTVVYVGDQVKELGNTVYIRHADGFYTGYSHLGKVSVKSGQKVAQGQAVGTMGKSGAVDRPQLHFEVRYTPSSEIAKPFDPTLVLP
ncbi:peptidoglycan DD-metalloendopeptidase family protein [Asticcacaulis excentricus]|uniref:Peptidase M23 n=1 Tax=Asticcacaulis excentricus (strain ATCC 15261 / DSM 4724 / KCTC 12464 / NCIMB 9791 / VKM B-1370 / CB 48) TaxID=573065 RepID=E8RNL7_ASTEC|nr:peptidoglycan DD-metalloendopeptidase family protein [Asticcacaulis excentricus]ADU12913.1 Peptidase M23 [Asticcacaulis excentricus CB 48]